MGLRLHTSGDRRTAAKTNRSPCGYCSKGELSNCPQETCTTVSRQPLNSLVADRI
jgi:hypothetical protein